jgi:predicted DNA-binding protein with PD1-like motif
MTQLSFRLKDGDLLKESIERLAEANGIKAGVLLSVVGSLKNAVLRMAGSTADNQIIKKWAGDFEIVAGTGTFSADGCHLHAALSDKDGNVIGGHLKDGCVVNTTAEIVIGILEGVSFRRLHDAGTGFKELSVK